MAHPGETTGEPADRGARTIHDAFRLLQQQFREVTHRAADRFLERDWRGARADQLERLNLYPRSLDVVVAELTRLLGHQCHRETTWRKIRKVYVGLVAEEGNLDLAQTYFNSVTRRIFSTVGVNPAIEFLSRESLADRTSLPSDRARLHQPEGDLPGTLRGILESGFPIGAFRDAEGNITLAAAEIGRFLRARLGSDRVESIEMWRAPFFRDNAGYLIGRLRCTNAVVPLVLPIRHDANGLYVDAVLMNEGEVSILFSFTRSYFFVETTCPSELVVFLRSILPLKPLSELYASLGINRHAKTELYRGLIHRLESSDDRFHVAEGDRGMVMIVFALGSYDIVFKVIRDRFDYPKTTTHRQVRERYRLVFQHDRVGRLVDAQEFEHLTFRRDRFQKELLEELVESAAGSVFVQGDEVVIRHLYTERRITPLNVYLRSAFEGEATQAVIDYGEAIKELAAANIFPGDFLLKNFGVTRHRRVVFYDYDELCLLTDCRFRRMPPARTVEDELESEPWFTVAENDIFPEEFRKFLGLRDGLREVFVRHHEELFATEFWCEMQNRHKRGEIGDVYPYPRRRRLRDPG